MEPEKQSEDEHLDSYAKMRNDIVIEGGKDFFEEKIKNLESEISQLKDTIKEKDRNITSLQLKIGGVMKDSEMFEDSAQKQLQLLQAERDELLKKIEKFDEIKEMEFRNLQDKIADLQVEVKNNRDVINELVRVAIRVIFGDPEAKEILRNYIIKFGYPYHKVLLHILERRETTLEKIVESTQIEESQIEDLLQILTDEGLIYIRKGFILPTSITKSDEYIDWANLPKELLMSEMLDHVRKFKDRPEKIMRALEELSEVLVNVHHIRGPIIYQIGNEATRWRKEQGNLFELEEKIQNWLGNL